MNEIQRIKDKYGNEAESIIMTGLNLEKRGKKYRCPNIYAHKNRDRNPSMSYDPQANHFYCFTCGNKIDLYGYYKDHLNYTHREIVSQLLGDGDLQEKPMVKNRNEFENQLKNIKPLSKECTDYIKLRGITEETADNFKIKTYKGMIAFPYYRYETVVGYKIRKPTKNPGKPKMTSMTGSKPYLFNSQNVKEGTELIICEGEFDAMIIHQTGFPNVVSVGAGANSMGTIIEQAKDFLDRFETLIIISDNDEAGKNMDEYFTTTFGEKAKLIDKKLYSKEGSDINEEHAKKGTEKIRQIIESARFKIEGRRDLDKEPYRGITSRPGKYIPTGLKTVDNALNDLIPGGTTLITGRSNGGKTTVVKQIMANAIDKGSKVYLVNGENEQEIFLNEFYQCIIGRDDKYYNIIKLNKKYKKEPKQEVLSKLQAWHKGKFTMFNKGESKLKTMQQLLEMIKMEIKFNGHELVIVDNLMSVLSVQASEKNEAQADFMQNLCDMAKNYNSHIILVLHPNKTYQKGQEMDFEQISGTSDLYNKADNIITVIREYNEEKISEGINGKINVLKNRYEGELPYIDVHFDKETRLLLEIDEETNDILAYNFKWKNNYKNKEEVKKDAGFEGLF